MKRLRLIVADADPNYNNILSKNGNDFLIAITNYVKINPNFYTQLSEDEKEEFINKLDSCFSSNEFDNFGTNDIKALEPLFNILKNTTEWNNIKQRTGFQELNTKLTQLSGNNTNNINIDNMNLDSDGNKSQAAQYYNIKKEFITKQLMEDFAKMHPDKMA